MAKSSKPRPAAPTPKARPTDRPLEFPEVNWLEMLDRRATPAYLVAAGVMLLFLFWQFLFGQKLFLFDDSGTDTIDFFYPSLRHVADYLRETGLPAWSFRQGLGASIFPYGLSDVFDWPLYIAGGDRLMAWVPWVTTAKLLLGGLFFQRYLRLMNIGGYASVVGGLLFAFSGYAIVGSTWYVYSTSLVHASLLLLAFELFFQKGKWWLLPIAVGLVTAYSPVYAYVYVGFLAVYFAWRHFCGNFSNPSEGPAARADWLGFAKTSVRLLALAALGMALTVALWLPIVDQMLDSPRMGAANKSTGLAASPLFAQEAAPHNAMLALRTLSNDLAGSGRKFYGWRNYLESPLNYCGLLALLLLPQFFFGASRHARWWFGGLLALVVVPQFLPYLRYAFWLFTGNYYRAFSHLFGMTVQLFAVAVLVRLVREKKINLPVLGATLIGLLVFLFYPYELKVNAGLRLAIGGFLVAEAVLIYLATRPATRSIGLAGLALMVVGELSMNSWPSLNDRNAVTKTDWEKGYYNDDSQAAVRWIQARDSTFYRITKKIHSGAKGIRSCNDAKVQGFYGNSSYHSFNHPGLVNLQIATGAIDTGGRANIQLVEAQTRWSRGLESWYFLDYLTASKYTIQPDTERMSPFYKLMMDSLTTIGHARVYRQRANIPLGSTYEKYIPELKAATLGAPLRKQAALLRAAAVKEADIPRLAGLEELPLDSVPEPNQYATRAIFADAHRLTLDSFYVETFSPNRVAGHIDLKKRKLLSLCIPFDKGWAVTVDGQPTVPIRTNHAFIGLPLDAGSHRVELNFSVPFLRSGAMVSFGALMVYLLMLFLRLGK